MSAYEDLAMASMRNQSDARQQVGQGLATISGAVQDYEKQPDHQQASLVQKYAALVHSGTLPAKDAAIMFKLEAGGHIPPQRFQTIGPAPTPNGVSPQAGGMPAATPGGGVYSMPQSVTEAPPEGMSLEEAAQARANPYYGQKFTQADVNTLMGKGNGLTFEQRQQLQNENNSFKGGQKDKDRQAKSEDTNKRMTSAAERLGIKIDHESDMQKNELDFKNDKLKADAQLEVYKQTEAMKRLMLSLENRMQGITSKNANAMDIAAIKIDADQLKSVYGNLAQVRSSTPELAQDEGALKAAESMVKRIDTLQPRVDTAMSNARGARGITQPAGAPPPTVPNPSAGRSTGSSYSKTNVSVPNGLTSNPVQPPGQTPPQNAAPKIHGVTKDGKMVLIEVNGVKQRVPNDGSVVPLMKPAQ